MAPTAQEEPFSSLKSCLKSPSVALGELYSVKMQCRTQSYQIPGGAIGTYWIAIINFSVIITFCNTKFITAVGETALWLAECHCALFSHHCAYRSKGSLDAFAKIVNFKEWNEKENCLAKES